MKNLYITILFLAITSLGYTQGEGPTIEVSGACYGHFITVNGSEYNNALFYNCWDLNQNGIGDPSEDTNGDGVFNSADCAGGLLCWDTNGNGVGDPAEDINSDGVFDVHDCPTCWDTNFNGIQDPDEDANGDGQWNTDDCVNNTSDGCTRAPLVDVNLASSNLLEITDDPMREYNGTSTLDIVNMRKWLVDGYPGSLEAIVSDFDGDGTVSTSDVKDLQRYVLGIDNFPQYTKYRAVLKDFVFPTVNPFNQNVDYSSLTFADTDIVDDVLEIFVFRIGDTDQSALFQNEKIEERSRTALSFEDISMEAGKSYKVAFRLSDDDGILGSSFRLATDRLAIEAFDSDEDMVYNNESSRIGITYVSYKSKAELSFELTMIAEEDTNLSDLISLDESFLKELVDSKLNTKTLSLNPRLADNETIIIENEISIYPNPVENVLSIEFPSSTERTISLANVSGQNIYNYKLSADRLDLERTAAMQSGLYFLTINSEEGIKTYKLFYR